MLFLNTIYKLFILLTRLSNLRKGAVSQENIHYKNLRSEFTNIQYQTLFSDLL